MLSQDMQIAGAAKGFVLRFLSLQNDMELEVRRWRQMCKMHRVQNQRLQRCARFLFENLDRARDWSRAYSRSRTAQLLGLRTWFCINVCRWQETKHQDDSWKGWDWHRDWLERWHKHTHTHTRIDYHRLAERWLRIEVGPFGSICARCGLFVFETQNRAARCESGNWCLKFTFSEHGAPCSTVHTTVHFRYFSLDGVFEVFHAYLVPVLQGRTFSTRTVTCMVGWQRTESRAQIDQFFKGNEAHVRSSKTWRLKWKSRDYWMN